MSTFNPQPLTDKFPVNKNIQVDVVENAGAVYVQIGKYYIDKVDNAVKMAKGIWVPIAEIRNLQDAIKDALAQLDQKYAPVPSPRDELEQKEA